MKSKISKNKVIKMSNTIWNKIWDINLPISLLKLKKWPVKDQFLYPGKVNGDSFQMRNCRVNCSSLVQLIKFNNRKVKMTLNNIFKLKYLQLNGKV